MAKTVLLQVKNAHDEFSRRHRPYDGVI